MEPGKLSFSTFQLNIDNIAFTKNALQAFNITFPYKNIEQDERRSKKVFIDIKHNNYPVSYTHLDVYKRQVLAKPQPCLRLPGYGFPCPPAYAGQCTAPP